MKRHLRKSIRVLIEAVSLLLICFSCCINDFRLSIWSILGILAIIAILIFNAILLNLDRNGFK